jgi:Cu/Ag efflux pump CusA
VVGAAGSGRDSKKCRAIIAAVKEVGPSLFFSLLVITVSFLPVFALEDQEGRLFKPLAFTKTFAMAGGALWSVTLVPVLMLAFIRGRILPEARNPLNRLMIWLYRPVIGAVLRAPVFTILMAVLVLVATAWPGRQARDQIKLPPGYRIQWSGQYEYLERAAARLRIVVPATLLMIFVLLYLNFGRIAETLIVMLSVPFALVGGAWLMWWLGYNLSVAVAVGFIALAGVAAETGVVMLIYLDQAWRAIRDRRQTEGHTLTPADLDRAIVAGAVERVRPKMMTVIAIMAGLLPILWSSGTGSELMRRIAVPMVGGMVSSTVLTLLVIPALYALVKRWQLRRASDVAPATTRRRLHPAD